MEINLIIPRHPYGSLKPENGSKREYLHLSPEGVQALNRLATCSRGAAADLAIRVLDAVTFGDCARIGVIGLELAKVINTNDGLTWSAAGLEGLAQILELHFDARTEP